MSLNRHSDFENTLKLNIDKLAILWLDMSVHFPRDLGVVMDTQETRSIKASERQGSRTKAISLGLVQGIIFVALASVAIIFGLRFLRSSVMPFIADLSSWLTFLIGLGIGVVVGALLADRFAKLGGWKG
jgi:hypothetical protein